MQGTVTDFQGSNRDIVADVQGAAKVIQGLFLERLPGYLNIMSASNLNTAFSANGLSGIITELLFIIDDASTFAVNTTTLLSDSYKQERQSSFTGSKMYLVCACLLSRKTDCLQAVYACLCSSGLTPPLLWYRRPCSAGWHVTRQPS